MNLQELEARLRGLMETRMIRAMPGQRPEDLLIQRLRDAVRSNAQTDQDGAQVAPNVYTLRVHSGSLDHWKGAELEGALIELLNMAAADGGLRFDAPPALTFAEDERVLPGALEIIASHSVKSLQKTQDMQAQTGSQAGSEDVGTVPKNAFLIVEGVKEFPLNQTVINIGRRLDNNLVVDDPRVSRHHAQLRAIKGRFVLFDLNSSGGTFINGQRASQSILYPGDVISLAGVSLIFGQDSPWPQRASGATGPRSVGGERRTAIIRSRPLGVKKRT
jgi:pSer/pThr/pTyr-binding forkhead associated (FHA) protein